MPNKKYVLKKIYDIRPLDENGEIDFEWIKKGKKSSRKKKQKQPNRKTQKKEINLKQLQPRWEKETHTKTSPTKSPSKQRSIWKKVRVKKPNLNFKSLTPNWKSLAPSWEQSLKPIFQLSAPRLSFAYIRPRGTYFSFIATLLLVAISITGFSFLNKALNLKSQALASSNNAYKEILNARENLKELDSKAATANFENAYKDFKSVEESGGIISKATFKLASLSPTNNTITAGRKLIKSGQYFSKGGTKLTKTLSLVKSIKLDSLLDEGGSKADLGALLKESSKNIDQALVDFKKANQFAQNTDIEEVPGNYRNKVKTLQQSLPELINLLSKQKEYLKLAQILIGQEEHKRYLIAFQNNSEIRPTGGFIGSYAEITFFNGKLKNLKVDDIYNIDGQLSAQVVPPEPIQKISSAWSTHDANWFFDYPTSAQKIMKFYELTGQSSVEGVIAITPRVLKEVLKTTGPIKLPKYKKTISAGNFLTVLQQHVEKDYNKKINQPKRILADFTPKIIETISQLEREKLQGLIKAGQEMLTEKDILLYSEEEELQKRIELNGWGGNVIQGSDDYLAVVNANINGYKTDRYIKQTTDLNLTIDSDQLDHKLKITRNHKGGDKEQSFYNKVNTNYMRVFLPKDAKINSVNGFTPERIEAPVDYEKQNFQKDPLVKKIKTNKKYNSEKGYFKSRQHGKKVIGGWVYTSPGNKTSVEIDYSLDISETKKELSFLFQKQPGQDKHKLDLTINAPDRIQTRKATDRLQVKSDEATLKTPFTKDELINIGWK